MITIEEYILSGRFIEVAKDAVAEAIAQAEALGLPMEGCMTTADDQQSSSQETKEQAIKKVA
ncbi:MAG: hypothetical protein LBM17_01180 [Candidatus Accumulibacter sp.]|jgi:hypothetical protein|nr:hypothetical protein [Accumulibacter sp.]